MAKYSEEELNKRFLFREEKKRKDLLCRAYLPIAYGFDSLRDVFFITDCKVLSTGSLINDGPTQSSQSYRTGFNSY